MKLSEHFTLEEFIESATAKAKRINNTPTHEAAANIALLVCHILEPARVAYGSPISISSGYRCPKLNKAVGGVSNSQHQYGQAADLQCKDLKCLFDILKDMDVDQLLFEHNASGTKWIHVSFNIEGNRHMVRDNYLAK